MNKRDSNISPVEKNINLSLKNNPEIIIEEPIFITEEIN